MTVAPLERAALPRLGFLGVGWIGRHRMEALSQSGLSRIVAIADASPQVLEAARHSAPGCGVVSSFEELLRCEPDGVVIATPSAFHAEQTIAALKRNMAVFCQKPLGRNEQEVRRVIEAAKKADRLLGVDLSYRHVRGVPELRERIQAGELGHIFAADLVFHNAYGPDKPWFYDPKLSGGGCVMDLGIHLVDLALWMLPGAQVRSVTSRLFSQGAPIHGRDEAVEDYAVARMDLESGTAVQLSCSWKLSAGRDAIIEASFYGTKAGAALRNVDGSFYDFTVERFSGTSREVLSTPPDAWGGRAAVSWVKQLARGVGFDSEVERLIEVARALDQIYSP